MKRRNYHQRKPPHASPQRHKSLDTAWHSSQAVWRSPPHRLCPELSRYPANIYRHYYLLLLLFTGLKSLQMGSKFSPERWSWISEFCLKYSTNQTTTTPDDSWLLNVHFPATRVNQQIPLCHQPLPVGSLEYRSKSSSPSPDILQWRSPHNVLHSDSSFSLHSSKEKIL